MLSFSDKTKQKKGKMRTTVAVLFEKKKFYTNSASE